MNTADPIFLLEAPNRLPPSRPLCGDAAQAGYHPTMMNGRARLSEYEDSTWPVLLAGERGAGKCQAHRAGSAMFLDDVSECPPRFHAKLLTILGDVEPARFAGEASSGSPRPFDYIRVIIPRLPNSPLVQIARFPVGICQYQ